MNILGLVFSLLLILSYGFYACWDKQTASTKLRTTYIGHQKANRKLLNKYQSEIYQSFRSKKKISSNQVEEDLVDQEEEAPTKALPLEFNRECAKLNLRPLIQEGRAAHPLIYELAAKMIRTFYGSFSKEKRFEYHLLDTLLESAKTNSSLEKLDLGKWQRTYYKMLKGTKEWNLATHKGYPPFLDYVRIVEGPEKLCIFHAHPDLITIVFDPSVATKLHREIHTQNGPLLTKELIERICSEEHVRAPLELIDILELGKPNHEEIRKTLVARDEMTQISLRKNVSVESFKAGAK